MRSQLTALLPPLIRRITDEAGPPTVEALMRVPGYLRGPVTRRLAQLEDQWVQATDPASGAPCWKHITTGELTPPGLPKPDTWLQVVDKSTGLLYHWNRNTGDTTDVGEARPGPYDRPDPARPSGRTALPVPQENATHVHVAGSTGSGAGGQPSLMQSDSLLPSQPLKLPPNTMSEAEAQPRKGSEGGGSGDQGTDPGVEAKTASTSGTGTARPGFVADVRATLATPGGKVFARVIAGLLVLDVAQRVVYWVWPHT
ncbi:hypothetical protein V8C86DRAFT_2545305 [Haematococcus lacustris]